MSATSGIGELSARRFLAIAGTLGALGIAANLNGDGTLAKLIAVAGVVTMIWSIHRFGRLGPDGPIVFATPEPADGAPKKKRKKKKRADPVAGDEPAEP